MDLGALPNWFRKYLKPKASMAAHTYSLPAIPQPEGHHVHSGNLRELRQRLLVQRGSIGLR
eukprot:8401329-Pyramimonas_sp.AAC.1